MENKDIKISPTSHPTKSEDYEVEDYISKIWFEWKEKEILNNSNANEIDQFIDHTKVKFNREALSRFISELFI